MPVKYAMVLGTARTTLSASGTFTSAMETAMYASTTGLRVDMQGQLGFTVTPQEDFNFNR